MTRLSRWWTASFHKVELIFQAHSFRPLFLDFSVGGKQLALKLGDALLVVIGTGALPLLLLFLENLDGAVLLLEHGLLCNHLVGVRELLLLEDNELGQTIVERHLFAKKIHDDLELITLLSKAVDLLLC